MEHKGELTLAVTRHLEAGAQAAEQGAAVRDHWQLDEERQPLELGLEIESEGGDTHAD